MIIATPTLAGYVIKHCAEYLFFADDNGTPTDDFESAVAYSSKLQAHQRCAEFFRLQELEQDAAWEIVKRREVIQRAPKLEAPFALAISDPLEAVRYVYDLHCKYSQRISDWLRRAGVTDVPQQAACKMTITAPKWAGIWSPNGRECHYPVVYAMMAQDFHMIVAHEVVHSYQHAFCGRGSGHGNDFYALMKHAAQEPITRHTHTYNVGEARRLSETLKPWWKKVGQKGLLQSLPVEIVTEPMRRKGIIT